MTEENKGNIDDILDDTIADDDLNDLFDDEKEDEDKDKDKDKKNGDDDDKKSTTFSKKVGNREFTSEKDYDDFVLKMYGTNGNLAGEVRRLGGDPKAISKGLDKINPDEKKEDKPNVTVHKTAEESYYEIEAIKFSKQFPDAKEYADEMQIAIKKGKANINGEPSYALALARALRADGKEIPQKLITRIKAEKGDDESDSKTASKKIMKAGSRAGNAQSEQRSYSRDDVQSASDFGNKIASGKLKLY